MTAEAAILVEDDALTLPDEEDGYEDAYEQSPYLEWTAVFAGALAAAAFSFILVTFGVTIGLGVSSSSPTWRDASAALSLLSGFYLILQAIVSFGLGGYIAGRVRSPLAAPVRDEPVIDEPVMDETETRDGLHGLAAWALAVLLGAALATLAGAASIGHSSVTALAGNTTAAEPLLSYELDRLFRSPRPPANVDMNAERAEAGRILMTSSSHSGVSADDRTYLIQQVAATTGLSPGDAEKRVDQAIANSKSAIAHARRSTIILAFSLAAAALLGAVSAWAAAVAGGRRRDGEPLPEWMAFANRREPGMGAR